MKLLLAVLIICLLLRCSDKTNGGKVEPSKYTFLNKRTDDTPDRSQYVEYIVLNKPIPKDTLTKLLNERLAYGGSIHFKYHNPAMYLYIFVYKSREAYDHGGYTGTISRIMGIDQGIKYNEKN